MKIAITNSNDSYALRMKDSVGELSIKYLEFVRNLFLEVGIKQDFLLDWDFAIGVEDDELSLDGNYEVYEVSDFMGYLVLGYQRDLRNGLSTLYNLKEKREAVVTV